MPLPTPESKTKVWPRHPAGSYQIVLADVIYLGKRIKEWNKERFPQERLATVWQSLEIEPGTEARRFELAAEFTYSAHEKAKLRAFLNRWIGPFQNDEEAKQAVINLDSRIGHNAIGTVTQSPARDGSGKVFVSVEAVAPLMKGMVPQAVVGYERRKYWTDKIAKYAADYQMWLADQDKEQAAQEERLEDFPAALQGDGADSSDLPF